MSAAPRPPLASDGEKKRKLLAIRQESLLTVFARVVVIICGMGTSIISARTLGPDGRGEYFYVLTLAGMVAQFGNLGLHSSNTYLLAKDQRLLSRLTVNSIWTSAVLGMSGALAVRLMTSRASHNAVAPIASFSCLVLLAPALIFSMLGINLFVGLNRFRTFNLVLIGSSVLGLMLIACAAVIARTPFAFLLAVALHQALVCGAILYLTLRTEGCALNWRFDWRLFQQGFTYSLKAYLCCLLGYLMLKTNVILIEHLAGPRELGIYSIASQVLDTLMILPSSVALVLLPKLIRDEQGDRWEVMLKSMKVTTLMVALICLGAGVCLRWGIGLLFGPKYVESAQLGLYLLPAVIISTPIPMLSHYLAAIGYPKEQVGIWLIGAGLSLGLGWLFTVRAGAAGACLSLSISYAAVGMSLWFLAKARRGAILLESTFKSGVRQA